MIVKVVKAGKAGSGRQLAAYVLDLKKEHAGERLGEYALDLKHGGEKVDWARTVNTGVDHPRFAIEAIEQHNAQNTRKHSISRMEHVIVSFPEGERPTREQMAVIEDRLMDSIGFGDHPRVSAVHKPGCQQRTGNNWHMHIAVSRIDPTTLKAEHPRHNHFNLQAEGARLELELGLKQERKTLLAREQSEIEYRREYQHGSLDRAHTERHPDPTTPAPAATQKPRFQWHDIEAYARDLSPRYADAGDAKGMAQREVDKVEKRERGQRYKLFQAGEGVKERWREMSIWRKAAHKIGGRDKEITEHERAAEKAKAALVKLAPEVAGKAKDLERAKKEYVAARAEIWPRAEQAKREDWQQEIAKAQERQVQQRRERERGFDLER